MPEWTRLSQAIAASRWAVSVVASRHDIWPPDRRTSEALQRINKSVLTASV
jgi:hypothetical protein